MKKNKILMSLLLVSSISYAEAVNQPAKENIDAGSGEQVQQQVQVVAPNPPPELSQKMYNQGIQKIFPLSKEQMVDMDKQTTEFNVLKDDLKMGDAAPAVTSERLVEKPGAPIKQLNLHIGLDTIVTFLDSFGQPWPIEFAAPSNKAAYKVEVIADHMIKIEVKKPNVTADLTVLMVKGSLPFKFALKYSDSSVDTSKSYVIEGRSPTSNNKAPVVGGREAVPDAEYDLNTFLDDVPPPEALAINVNGPKDVEAWKYKGSLIVKTQKQLITPDGVPTFGANNWKVYRIESPSPILVLTQDGNDHYAYLPEDELVDLGKKDKGGDDVKY